MISQLSLFTEPKHIVALSGGKDSTAMALRLRELNPRQEYIYIATPTGNELPELFDHLAKLEEMLSTPITYLTDPATDNLLTQIRNEKFIPNFQRRFCTKLLKIKPTERFLRAKAPCIHYVGLRADEPERKGIYGEIKGVTHAFPMRDWNWTIDDAWNYLESKGIRIPRRTDCALCFFQRLPEWRYLYENHPEAYAKGIEIETEMQHTFRSDSRDQWPAALEPLAREFDTGRPLRGWKAYTQRMQSDCDREALCRVCSM